MFRIVGIFGSRSILYAKGKKQTNKQRIFVLEKKKKKGKREEGGEGGGEEEEEEEKEKEEEEEKPGHRVISFRIDSFSTYTYTCTCTYTCPFYISYVYVYMSKVHVLLRPCLYPAIPGFLDFRCDVMIEYPDVHIFLLDPDIIPID